MAVSEASLTDAFFMQPKLDSINLRAADQLQLILLRQEQPVELSFSNVKSISNVAARIIIKTLLEAPSLIHISNMNAAVQTTLYWAADYLYSKGELDDNRDIIG